jgi:hypothetical protein
MERRASENSSTAVMSAERKNSAQFVDAFNGKTITSVGCIGAGRVGVCTMAIMAKRKVAVHTTLLARLMTFSSTGSRMSSSQYSTMIHTLYAPAKPDRCHSMSLSW